jgi:hypothetical protein
VLGGAADVVAAVPAVAGPASPVLLLVVPFWFGFRRYRFRMLLDTSTSCSLSVRSRKMKTRSKRDKMGLAMFKFSATVLDML